MYWTVWDDYEGARHALAFNSLEDACLEALALEKRFDFVAVVFGGEANPWKL